MCLGVPGKVISVEGMVALVDFFGLRRRVRLDVVNEPVAPGDYVLNHVGFAIRRISEEDAQATLELFDDLLRDGGEDDLMRADVQAEIDATRGGAP